MKFVMLNVKQKYIAIIFYFDLNMMQYSEIYFG